MEKISVVIITYNEARNIGRCNENGLTYKARSGTRDNKIKS